MAYKQKASQINLALLFTYGMSMESWERGGLLDRELLYYRKLLDQGLRNVALMTYASGDVRYRSEVSPMIVLPKRRFRNNFVYSLLAPFLHFSQFKVTDIIKSNQSLGAWTGLVAKLLLPRIRFVVRCGWVRTDEMMRRDWNLKGLGLLLNKAVEWLVFRFSDAIFVTTPSDKQYIKNHYRIHTGKIKVVPNSIDTDLFFPSARDHDWKSPIKIISIGRFVPMKNFQSLILACKDFARCLEIQLIGNGPYREKLIDMASEEQVNVKFLTNIPNNKIPNYLQMADVFVMPQLYGSGMSKVLIEAMACGLITVGSDIRAHRETICEGVNGFLCDSDPRSIRQCLERLLSLDPSTLNAITKKARQDVLNNYSMHTNAFKELKILESIIP